MKPSVLVLAMCILCCSCKYKSIQVVEEPSVKILFLHHSTGNVVWEGDKKIMPFLSQRHNQPAVPWLISEYNKTKGTKYAIDELTFPKGEPYPWKNYPFDYYNIWVKHAGDLAYMEEPTLEMLTKKYNVIIFKHCYPVSSLQQDDSATSANNETKTLANYKIQYDSLKIKLNSFPDTKFIVWTGSALVQSKTSEEQAERANEFAQWVKEKWDQPGDNIYIWDFRKLETEGGLYLTNKNARNNNDSHPSEKFGEKAAILFVARITSIIENNGEDTDLTGAKMN